MPRRVLLTDIKMMLRANNRPWNDARVAKLPFDAMGRFIYDCARIGAYADDVQVVFYRCKVATLRPVEHVFSASFEKIFRFWGKCVADRRHICSSTLVLLANFALASCAVSPIGDDIAVTPEAKSEAAVAKRVNERWDAMIRGDLDSVYALLSPGSKATTTLDHFKRVSRRSGFREARIKTVDCDAQVCKVILTVTYDHPKMKGIQTPVEETWVFDHGQAWYVYRE